MWQIGTHILVAARDGDVCVVMLRAHDGLDAVGYEVSGLQAVAHAPRAHGDGVADPDGVEAEGHHAGLADAIAHGLGEAEQVHVAGVALVPDRRDADLRLAEVGIGEADAVEHGLRGALRLGLGDAGAVLVELWLVGDRRGADALKAAAGGGEADRREGRGGERQGLHRGGGEVWCGV
jgi:hypothetical protein